MTSSQAIDLDEFAAIATRVLGKSVGRKLLSDAEFKARMAARGVPEGNAQLALGLYIAARNGEFATVDPTLETILGRRPTGMHELIAGITAP